MACEPEEQRVRILEGQLAAAEAACYEAQQNNDPNTGVVCSRVTVMHSLLTSAQQELQRCLTSGEPQPPQHPQLLTGSGFIKLLIVQQSNRGYGGGQTNVLTTEVVFTLQHDPIHAFGFNLRGPDDVVAHEAMFALLRDAYIHNLPVHFDYIRQAELPNQNSLVIRVWLDKVAPDPVGPIGDFGIGPE